MPTPPLTTCVLRPGFWSGRAAEAAKQATTTTRRNEMASKIVKAVKDKVAYERESYRMSQEHVRQVLGKGDKKSGKR
jgi:hypothetical protein